MEKHVVTSVFGDDEEKKPKPQVMNITLHEHETIHQLIVEVPEDLSTREWKLGEPIVFKILGIEGKGLERA